MYVYEDTLTGKERQNIRLTAKKQKRLNIEKGKNGITKNANPRS